MKEILIHCMYFILGFIYAHIVAMFNRWYRKNRRLFKEFITEYKKLNQKQRKVVKKNVHYN